VDRRVVAGIAVAAVAIGASLALTFQTFDAALNAQVNNPKIGMVINPPTPTPDARLISEVYGQAAATGIGRSNVYVFWDDVEPRRGEYDWRQSDILMSLNKNNNLKVTLYFSLINGKTLGPFPDWMGRPGLASVDPAQVAAVLDAILERYHIVDSVVIAGETDEHFRYDEQSIPAYRELFEEVYAELKTRHPDVRFGNAYSLHGVINKGLQHVVAELDVGDFVGFTYFPVDSLNDIVRTPDEAVADLERAREIAGGKKVAFLEVSWSTSGFVNGSGEDQRRFVANTFDFYNENHGDIEFLTWYRQYDRPAGTCSFDAELGAKEVAVGGGPGLGSNEHVIERLNNYVCSAGLIDSEGAPKAGWNEFAARVPKSR